MTLFLGRVSRLKIWAVLNPDLEHSVKKSSESAIIDISSSPKSVVILGDSDINTSLFWSVGDKIALDAHLHELIFGVRPR